MPLILEIQDALPYIDGEPSAEERASIKTIISEELPEDHTSALHPSIKTDYEPQFSNLINEAHEKIAKAGKPRADGEGVDLLRYEEPSQPEASDGTTAWQNVLKTAYTSHEYLQQRAQNLELLEAHGKNAWLIGNSQLEHQLKSLEQDLTKVREEGVQVGEERRIRQEQAKGEFQGLEHSWKDAIGRAIEAEVAGETLQRQIEHKRRGG